MAAEPAVAVADLATIVGGFGDLLHRAGVPVTPERAGRLATAIDLAAPASIDELYWLARVTLLSTVADVGPFDRVFAQLFRGLWDPADGRGDPNVPGGLAGQPTGQPGARGGHEPSTGSPPAGRSTLLATDERAADGSHDGALGAWSAEERLRHQEFATLTTDEVVALRALMSRLALAPPPRRSRRSARHRHGRVDLRASLRRARRSGGDPSTLVRRQPRTRPRRLVFICDISGSMEPYARAYLQLLHSAVGAARAEAYVFATRLTRLTRILHATTPDLALHRAGQAAPDWSGGTRIGRALLAFNERYGRRGVARGAVVVIVSDGWERDDPALLGREMERLHRLAHRIIWVNPRLAAPAYQPLVGGMAAALPHVDEIVSGHSMAAIDELLAAIAT